MPLEGIKAVLACWLGERFGRPPHEVLEWPVETMRLVEIDRMMREARPAQKGN